MEWEKTVKRVSSETFSNDTVYFSKEHYTVFHRDKLKLVL